MKVELSPHSRTIKPTTSWRPDPDPDPDQRCCCSSLPLSNLAERGPRAATIHYVSHCDYGHCRAGPDRAGDSPAAAGRDRVGNKPVSCVQGHHLVAEFKASAIEVWKRRPRSCSSPLQEVFFFPIRSSRLSDSRSAESWLQWHSRYIVLFPGT